MAQGIQKGLAKIPLLWPFFEEVHIPDHQLQLGDLLQLSASKMEIFWKYVRSPNKIELKFQGKHGHTQHWLSMAIFFNCPFDLRFKIERSESSRGFTG